MFRMHRSTAQTQTNHCAAPFRSTSGSHTDFRFEAAGKQVLRSCAMAAKMLRMQILRNTVHSCFWYDRSFGITDSFFCPQTLLGLLSQPAVSSHFFSLSSISSWKSQMTRRAIYHWTRLCTCCHGEESTCAICSTTDIVPHGRITFSTVTSATVFTRFEVWSEPLYGQTFQSFARCFLHLYRLSSSGGATAAAGARRGGI